MPGGDWEGLGLMYAGYTNSSYRCSPEKFVDGVESRSKTEGFMC